MRPFRLYGEIEAAVSMSRRERGDVFRDWNDNLDEQQGLTQASDMLSEFVPVMWDEGRTDAVLHGCMLGIGDHRDEGQL